MSFIVALFWLSGFMIVYPYAIYPVLLWALVLFKRDERPGDRGSHEPKVTLLISAYNEEFVIEEKLKNALALNYPTGRLQIVVVSDGSTDRTDAIVSHYTDQGVRLLHYEGRIGKTACLNRTVPQANGEIVVFSDANSIYDRDAIRELVQNFRDPRVGFVTGRTNYIPKGTNSASGSIGLHARLERTIKQLESRVGSCIGADGAILAIRKELYRPLRDYDINDLVIPMDVVAQGYLGRLEDRAVCSEQTAEEVGDEFRRQIRITNRTIRAIFGHAALLNPFRYQLFAFELFSHKVARLLVPFCMLLFLVTNVALLGSHPFYLLSLSGQIIVCLLAGANNSGRKFADLDRLMALSHGFIMVNTAILLGWVKFLKGETYVVWSPTQR